jgi:hypothetical protein
VPEIGEPFIPQVVFAKGGVFVGPIYPVCLMEYDGLTIYEKHCWVVLARCAGTDGRCFPSYDHLAKGAMSLRQAKKAIAGLRDKGFIEWTPGTKGRSNDYRLLWHDVFELGIQRAKYKKQLTDAQFSPNFIPESAYPAH